MDAERACTEKEPMVFAVDQRPFLAGGNRFCLLQPLMTVAGEKLSADPDGFPNRGRVWWLLRDVRDDLVVPGALWSGIIEHARKWDLNDPESDRFQVDFRTIQPGGRDLLEVLQVTEDDPDPALFQRPRPLTWNRPTAGQVILRGKKSVLGPLRADWDGEKQQLRLTPLQEKVYRVPVEAFRLLARMERFNVELNKYDKTGSLRSVVIVLTRHSWIDWDQARTKGEALDGWTDAQLLNWAARQQRLPVAQVQPLKTILAAITTDEEVPSEETAARRIQRLKLMASDAHRVLDMGEEVAKALSGTPVFADLLAKHVESLVAQRVEGEIKRRTKEIEDAIQPKQRQLDELRASISKLETEHDKLMGEHLRAIEREKAAYLTRLDERERSVGVREQRMAGEEQAIVQRLERVIERYRSEAKQVGDDVFTQLPLLGMLGLAARNVERSVASEPSNGEPHLRAANTPEARFTLPGFLATPRAVPGPALQEAEFIEQLRHVVEQQGFLYAPEDLISFHVCVKVGGLTVLAGVSGTGKSSLPRLYAEALGCRDEYLHIPVRPDWMDDRDLLGAFNAIAQRFEPASSGLVDRLIAALLDRQRERGGIYLVCLDEMNLARIEHYFAQFLSVLELPSGARHLDLFAPGLVRPSDPYSAYQRIPLGDNVRFVGTVNIDETTHFFSPKVLDRSQVLAFRAPDLAAPRRPAKSGPVHGVRPVTLATFLGWRRKATESGPARALMLEMNGILRRSRLGLGFRQYDRILEYVESARPFFTEDQALDSQFMQVVFPRLRPTAPGFADTLQDLHKLIVPERFPRSAEYLARLEASADDDFFQLL